MQNSMAQCLAGIPWVLPSLGHMIELPIRVAAPDVSHVDALANGTRLGEFEIRGLVGVGGFGMVYNAYDHSLQRDVAIKEYMPTAMASRADGSLNIAVRASNDEETFQKGLRSFIGEARMLAKFEHPSLVRVFRFWEANGTAYMVMPLYRGMTLKQARQCMRLPPTEAWLGKVLWCVLGALKMLHKGNALHRDVSPDNIFLQDTGPPVLLDLGAARLAIGDSGQQHTAVLKINYAPIEQYADTQSVPQGPWTDLYALAAVVHGLLRNHAPMPATVRVVNDRMPTFADVVKTVSSEFRQDYSAQFVSAIDWALHIQPQDRPQSVREFARGLGLATPHGMSSFDWRAELAPGSLPSGEVLQLSAARHTEEKTRPNPNADYVTTQFISMEDDADEEASTVIASWGPDSTPPPPPEKSAERRHRARDPVSVPAALASSSSARGKKPSRSTTKNGGTTTWRPAAIWTLVACLVLLTVLAASWGWRNWSTKGHAAAPGTETVLPQPQGAALGANQPAAAASSALASDPTPSAEPPLQNEPIETIIESSTPARPASAASSASAAADSKTAKANERARNAAAKAAKAEAGRTPVVAEAPSAATPVEVPAPVPEPKPAAPTVTPERLCSDANFLTRPMCMFRACQRADLAGTATCVELQKNLQRSKENNDTSKF